MKTDLIFLLVVALYIGYYLCKKESFTENFGEVEDEAARKAVRAIYNADIESIKTLSDVAKKLQAGGLTHPGRLFVNAGNDHLPITAASNGEAHIALRSHNNEGLNNYLINRGGHFRLHTHGVGDVFGVNRDGHTYINSGNNHLGLNVQSNTDSHILLRTKNDANKDLYLINRDGHFRLHQGGVGDVFGVNKDGHTYINSNNNHISLNVQSNTDPHIQLKTKNDDGKNVYLINRDGHFRVHHHGIGDRLEVNRDGNTVVNGALHTPAKPLIITRYMDVFRNQWKPTGVGLDYQIIAITQLGHAGKWETDDILITKVGGQWLLHGRNSRYGWEGSSFPVLVTFALSSITNSNFNNQVWW
jgi:hypothetical protein